VNWSTSGNNITLQLNQTRTAGATITYFPMPVVLRAANTGNTVNTLLTFYDRGDSVFVAGNGITLAGGVAGNTISVNLSFAPATLSFDPNNVTMATGTTTKVSSLKQALPDKVTGKVIVYPNPADKEITIQRIAPAAGMITITDIYGKVILRRSVVNTTEKINTAQLAPGNYIVQVLENGGITRTEKLVIQH
jgi:Secretion system C-terminal sorting domain